MTPAQARNLVLSKFPDAKCQRLNLGNGGYCFQVMADDKVLSPSTYSREMAWQKAAEEAGAPQMTAKEKQRVINHIDQAAKLCAKHGLMLGNGGDIASMLTGIASEIANGDAKGNEFLKEDA